MRRGFTPLLVACLLLAAAVPGPCRPAGSGAQVARYDDNRTPYAVMDAILRGLVAISHTPPWLRPGEVRTGSRFTKVDIDMDIWRQRRADGDPAAGKCTRRASNCAKRPDGCWKRPSSSTTAPPRPRTTNPNEYNRQAREKNRRATEVLKEAAKALKLYGSVGDGGGPEGPRRRRRPAATRCPAERGECPCPAARAASMWMPRGTG